MSVDVMVVMAVIVRMMVVMVSNVRCRRCLCEPKPFANIRRLSGRIECCQRKHQFRPCRTGIQNPCCRVPFGEFLLQRGQVFLGRRISSKLRFGDE